MKPKPKPKPVPDAQHLVLNEDAEAIQAVALAAAIGGNAHVRSQLPLLLSAFDEPYRTVAAVLRTKLLAGEFIDKHTVNVALGSVPLARIGANGAVQQLTASQVMNLIFATTMQPGQAEAYVSILVARQQAKLKADLQEKAIELAKSHGDDPEALLCGIEQLAKTARGVGQEKHASELFEMIPYLEQLTKEQKGTEFLGLNSGFPHLNSICNGLDTGLSIVTAPPGRGKTTWLWQVGCQVAEIEKVPVIMVSMEQSKKELRAKALARLSKLQYRHILRGRLRSDDVQNWLTLLAAAKKYAMIGRHLTVIEGDDSTTIDSIHHVASSKRAQAGATRCLILVDYLQVLPLRAEDSGRVTNTKDRVDLHVSALRRMARNLDSPVIAISSENRAGYASKQLHVFKESGGIEYTADIAMILTRSKQGDVAGGEFRSLDLNVVKNRNGECGVVKFRFYAKRAEFVETGKEALVEEAEE